MKIKLSSLDKSPSAALMKFFNHALLPLLLVLLPFPQLPMLPLILHRSLASLGYATQPISCAWITQMKFLPLYQHALLNKR